MTSFPKSGRLISEEYLHWIRGHKCAFCPNCELPGTAEAHHHPPKGRGVIDDTSTIPVCMSCHARCHGRTVDGLPPINPARQQLEVERMRALFLVEASPGEIARVEEDRRKWRDSRVYCG